MSNSTQPKVEDVISAIELLERVGDFQSITITLQDSSGAYCAALATRSLDASAMIQKLSTERGVTSVYLQRTI